MVNDVGKAFESIKRGLREAIAYQKRQFIYPVRLTRDRKDGGYVVSCRDLPEAITQGDTIEEARSEAEGALRTAIDGRIEYGLDIPLPSRAKRGERMVATPITTALKAADYLLMRGRGLTKARMRRVREFFETHHVEIENGEWYPPLED